MSFFFLNSKQRALKQIFFSVQLSVPGNVMFMTFQFWILKEQGSLWLKTKNILKKVAGWLRGKEQWRAVVFAGLCAMVSLKTHSIKRFSNFNF